jgi:hypothetical protein
MPGLIIFAIVVGTIIWVGVDASQRQWPKQGGFANSATGWVLGCILLWIVVFPLYLVRRGRAPLKDGISAGVSAPAAAAMYRECPHCKESMRRDAGVCPHCRNDSPPWTLYEGRWWVQANVHDAWQWFDESKSIWVKHPSETGNVAHLAR